MASEEMREMRKRAAGAPRRLVMHADGRPMSPEQYRVMNPTVPQEKVAPLIFTFLPGTRVSAMTYSLVHQFNVARLYRSKVADEWRPGHVQKLYGDGPDGLQVYIDLCRQNGYEAWFAMRANDTHNHADTEHGRMQWESCRFKQQHPEMMVGSRSAPPPYGRWSSLDYAQPVVREQVFRILQEVCQNYDVDGIQLDFFRHPTIFKSAAWGGQVSAEEVQMMTDLMRRLRAMMDQEGVRRGRPILFCVRAPDSAEYAKAIGLDIRTWMQEDLIDAWAAGSLFLLQDWSETVRLAHQYGCQLWASLDNSLASPNRLGINSLEGYRARALNAWRAGVDTIFLFNFF